MNEQQSPYAGVPRGSLIILQATVGSTVHGTAVQGTDDRDEMAVCIEPPERAIGLHGFETTVFRTQPEGVRSGPGDLDLVIHTLRKFVYLAARGNPSILLPLYVPPTSLIGKTHSLGHQLRDRRAMFLSKRVGKSFLGYLVAQKQRLLGERGQMRVKRQEGVLLENLETGFIEWCLGLYDLDPYYRKGLQRVMDARFPRGQSRDWGDNDDFDDDDDDDGDDMLPAPIASRYPNDVMNDLPPDDAEIECPKCKEHPGGACDEHATDDILF